MREKKIVYLGFPAWLKAKLNQNEVPLQPPKWLFEELLDAAMTLNYYQTSWLYNEVRKAYAKYAGIKDWKRVWIAPGADLFYDELFFHLGKKKVCASPRPTYFVFEMHAEHVGFHIKGPELLPPNWSLNIEKMRKYALQSDFIYIDNPNNPTGALVIDREGVIDVLDTGKPTLIDEAYYEFSGYTVAEMVEEYPNLAVLRTLSKAFRLAGLRVTFLIIGDYYRGFMHKGTVMFRIPTLGLLVALKALQNPSYVKETVRYIAKERERLLEGLRELGFVVYPSDANYILVKSNNKPSHKIVKQLKDAGILVRDVSKQLGSGYIRISIGSEEENILLLETLKKIVS